MVDTLRKNLQLILVRHAAWTGLSALALIFLALLTLVGCSHWTPPRNSTSVPKTPEFVSESECAGCHSNIAKVCVASNHARTLRAADRTVLGTLAPPAQEIPHTYYEVRTAGNRLEFASTLVPDAEKPMDLALGSGKLGMTYVALEKDDTLTEFRMSWYPGRKAWYLTPGQENDVNNGPGEKNDADRARRCLGCHAVTVPPKGLRPEDRFFGVGCQSCHGPASAHVAAAKAGQSTDLKMDPIGTWNATRINEMCGRCHRAARDVPTSGDEVTMTQRFQPYGLMQSPCFKKSGDKLSCITCHDPHGNISKDPRVYETACLRCHSAGQAPDAVAVHAERDAGRRKVCPVNPRDKCIGCHMPKRKVFPSSQIPISMADHLIWAYAKKSRPL